MINIFLATLESLGTSVGDETAVSISEALKTNTSLTDLVLWSLNHTKQHQKANAHNLLIVFKQITLLEIEELLH